MKKIIMTGLLSFLGLLSICAENLIKNGDFETGMRGWGVYSRRYYSNAETFERPKASSDAAFHGKKSLKIVQNGAESHDLISIPIKLEQGKTYTLSFYVKSDIPNKKITGCMHITGKTTGSGGTFADFSMACQKTWQRLTKTFIVPKAPEKRGFQDRYCIRVRAILPADEKGAIWFDGFQLEEGGKATDFKPGQDISVGIEAVNKSFPVYYIGDKIQAKSIVRSEKNEKQLSMEYSLENFYYGTFETIKKESFEIGANESIESVVELPPQKRGSYKLWAIIKDSNGKVLAKSEFLFGVISEEKNAEFKNDSFFGIHLPSARVVDWREFWNIPPRYELMFNGQVKPDEQFKLARDIGAKWIRTFHVFDMAFIHPREDKFNFEAVEEYLKLTDKYKLNVMPVLEDQLGNSQWERWGTAFAAIPPWARSSQKSLGGSSRGHNENLPDLKKWEEHINKLVAHFKGRISAWEMWNEPTVKMRGNEYMPILRAAARGARKGNPEVTVVGLCGTGDLGGDPLGWVKKALEFSDDPKALMDVISVHTYASPADNEENTIKRLFKIVGAKTSDGKPLPVWNTEVGTASVPAYSDIAPERIAYNRFMTYSPAKQAEFLAGKELMQMALGIQRHFYFILGFGPSHLGPGSGTFNLLEYDGAPRPSLIAYDAMTEIMEGAKFKEQLDLSVNDFCGVFEKGQEIIVFCWNFSDKAEKYDMSCSPDKIKLLDLMGNPMIPKKTEKGFELVFSNRPLYMIMPKEKFPAVKKAFASLKFAKNYTVDFIRLINGENGKACLGVKIDNRFNKALEFELELAKISSGWKLAENSLTKKVAPRGKELFLFPIAKTGQGDSLDVSFKLTENEGSAIKFISKKKIKFLVANEKGKKAVSSAKLDDVSQVKVKNLKNSWNGKKDASGIAQASWDMKNLYLNVIVKDNKVASAKDNALYNGDCVEIFFDIDIASNMKRFTAENYQILFSPDGRISKSKRGGGLKLDLSAINCKTLKTEDGYCMNIKIPWRVLKDANGEVFTPAKGKVVGFEIAIDDNDGEFKSRKSQIVWSGKGQAHANTNNYGAIILE